MSCAPGRFAIALAMMAGACEPPPPPPPEPLPVWFVAPPPTLAGYGVDKGSFGRLDAPMPSWPAGISGHARADVPVSVLDVGGAAWLVGPGGVEIVDVDKGVWTKHLDVHGHLEVLAGFVIASDDDSVRVLGLDGAPKWQSPRRLLAASDAQLVVTGDTPIEVAILAVEDGREVARVPAPAGKTSADVAGACNDKVLWMASVGRVAGCGPHILVRGTSALASVDAATGAVTATLEGVRGWWPARDGSDRIEVATGDGVVRVGRDLVDPELLALPVLGELVASRGDRRLVRATPRTAVLLDKQGVAAYVGLAEPTAVLGDADIVTAGRRFPVPADARTSVRVPAIHAGITLDAELRDLPDVVPLDESQAVASIDSAEIVGLALDGDDVYAAYRTGVARADVAAMSWRWTSPGCPSDARAVAVATEIVACTGAADTIATKKDGTAAWTAKLGGTAVLAAGDLAAVLDGDRAHVLDAKDGSLLGELASDDGGPIAVALVSDPHDTWLFAVSAGRLVAISPRAAMTPLWSMRVDGVVTRLSATGQGVLVELEGGDAYRVTLAAGVSPVGAIGLQWQASDDVLAGLGAGGPIPPNPMPVPPPPPPPNPLLIQQRLQNPSAFENLPPMSTPWPDVTGLLPSTQLALFAPAGGSLVRNDYALATPVALAPRTAGAQFVLVAGDGTVLVVGTTGDPRRRVRVPAGGAAFATSTATGIVLPRPLRLVRF